MSKGASDKGFDVRGLVPCWFVVFEFRVRRWMGLGGLLLPGSLALAAPPKSPWAVRGELDPTSGSCSELVPASAAECLYVSQDADGDGVLDRVDRCPLEPGAALSGCPDTDGDGVLDVDDRCPDAPAPNNLIGCPDTDEDGLLDNMDRCPQHPGLGPSGCPDTDGDGIVDPDDACPVSAGPAPSGCRNDPDNDGIVGWRDRCPREAEVFNGFRDDDGCPDQLPEDLAQIMGRVAALQFEPNQSTLALASRAVFWEAAAVCSSYPDIRLLVIGRAAERGSFVARRELSWRRAEAVRAELLAAGVDVSRVLVRGEDDTREGGAPVELRIIR